MCDKAYVYYINIPIQFSFNDVFSSQNYGFDWNDEIITFKYFLFNYIVFCKSVN